MELFKKILETMLDYIKKNNLDAKFIGAIGIDLWKKWSGKPQISAEFDETFLSKITHQKVFNFASPHFWFWVKADK